MTIREQKSVHADDVYKCLNNNKGRNIVVNEVLANGYKVTVTHDCSEPEFHMEVLHTFFTEHLHGELTMEEKNAIDYAIGAIKTLVDMGVLK